MKPHEVAATLRIIAPHGTRVGVYRPRIDPPRHPAVDDKCIHRGGLLGELEYGCCGRPAVLACAIHGRCMRHGTAKPTPIKFTPLVGSTEQLTKNQMPHVCSSCEEREEVKKQEFVEELSLDFSATER
jgi:hypothetical protein